MAYYSVNVIQSILYGLFYTVYYIRTIIYSLLYSFTSMFLPLAKTKIKKKRKVLLPTIRNIPKSIVTLYPFNLFKFTNMKKRIVQFLTTYFLIVLLFVLQKPVFMAYYHDLYKDASWGDYLSVMWHGLPLDCSLAGYLGSVDFSWG